MTSPTDDIVKGANDGVIGIIQLDDTSTEVDGGGGGNSGAGHSGGGPTRT